MQDDDGPPDDADVVAQVLRHLTWMPKGATLLEAPNERRSAQEASIDWQQTGAHAQFAELHAFTRGAPEGRMSELVGRAAAAGEQLGLAWTTDQELQRWYATGRDDPGLTMATRALAEMCAYFLLSAAHGLGNITLRTLTLSPSAAAVLARLRPQGRGYPPFSEEQDAWPPFNEKLAAHSLEAAKATGEDSVVALCEVLVTLAEDERWRAMEQRRHADYHRWRPQGLPGGGVPRRSLWTRPHPGTMQLSGATHFFEPVDHEALAATAGEALDALGDAMIRWDGLWPAALKALGVGVFRAEE